MNLKKGDRIRVTATILSIGPGGYVALKLDGSEARIAFWPDAAGEIELLEPENWPPQAGDIWEADGVEYHVDSVEYYHQYDQIQISPFLHNSSSLHYQGDDGVNQFRKRNPKLVRRRG